mgnify:CR=1 FL=1|tara:strand:+ start:643 stop:2229 length:1587 start_codon:yes stop_codon:yes gene_type:complete
MTQPSRFFVAQHYPKLLLLGFIIWHGFVLVWPAITDFNDGRFLLHMDERISYDQIKPITQARGPVDLVVALVGSDFRYGRLMYVLPAAVAGASDVIFGESGFISSIRLFFYLSILASALLVFKMGRYGWLSALAAITILSLPYTEYFATLPKPDAPQVLCLLIGLLALSKHRPLIAGLFIGLAMGFKLSSLFALPVLAVWLVSAVLRARLGDTQTSLTKANTWRFIGGFGLGMLANVPILLVIPYGWEVYLHSTIGNSAHGSDILGLPIVLWLKGFPQAVGGGLNTVAFGALFALAAAVVMRHLPKARLQSLPLSVLLLGIALTWFLAIVFTTPRLWGHYLWPSYVLLIAGLNLYLTHAPNTGWFPKTVRTVYLLGLLAICANAYALQNNRYQTQLPRPTATQQLRLESQYAQVQDYLQNLPSASEPWLIHFDPRLYQVGSTQAYSIENYWGPYHLWSQTPHAIIVQGQIVETSSQTRTEHDLELNEAHALAMPRLRAPHGNCQTAPCYELVLNRDDLAIWQKISQDP